MRVPIDDMAFCEECGTVHYPDAGTPQCPVCTVARYLARAHGNDALADAFGAELPGGGSE